MVRVRAGVRAKAGVRVRAGVRDKAVKCLTNSNRRLKPFLDRG